MSTPDPATHPWVPVWSLDDEGLTSTGLPTGCLAPFAGDTPPKGYLLCDGASYLVADYPDLFAVIGNKYGAPPDGEHFIVPDARGRSLVGVNPAAPPVDTLGKTEAEVYGAITTLTSRRPSHHHYNVGGLGIYDANHLHGLGDPGHAHWMSGWGGSVGVGGGVDGSMAPLPPGQGNAQMSTVGAGTGMWVGWISQYEGDGAGPKISGWVGPNYTSVPEGGTATGSRDTPAYLTANWIIKT